MTTYRNLAEQTVDRVDRKLDARLPPCSTSSTPLPGAVGIAEAREQLEDFAGLSEYGRQRILGIYGGRATQLLELAAADSDLSKVLDADKSVLAAEVVFAIRHEYANTLIDLMHRRLMLGLSADQGEQVAEKLAAVAACEFQWDEQEIKRQIGMLREYNARLKVA